MFAKLLEETLTSANPEKPLPADIYSRIETAISIRNVVAPSKRFDLDKQGTRLWNLSKKSAKDGELLCLGTSSSPQRFRSC